MKEASGELSMTVLTIIIVIAVLALWNTVIQPIASDWIQDRFGDLAETGDGDGNGGAVD